MICCLVASLKQWSQLTLDCLGKKLVIPYLPKQARHGGMVIHIYNPSYMGCTGGRILIYGLPRKIHETLAEKDVKKTGWEDDLSGKALIYQV
jgi:hypothetical protein